MKAWLGQTFYIFPFKNWVSRKQKQGFLIRQCLAFSFVFLIQASRKDSIQRKIICVMLKLFIFISQKYIMSVIKIISLRMQNIFVQPSHFAKKIQGRTKISFLTTRLFIGTHLSLRRFISFCFKCTCIAKNEILANISWNYRYIYKNQNWSQIVLGTIESIDWPVGLRFLHISRVINVNIQK